MKNDNKSKVTAHNLGQIGRKRDGATEVCKEHIARSDGEADSHGVARKATSDDCPDGQCRSRMRRQDGLKCEQLAIVTGASRGLGHALVLALRKANYRVVGCARSGADFPPEVHYFQTDLADAARFLPDFDRVWEEVGGESFGKIVLLNNAALLAPIGRLEDGPLEELQLHLRVNVHAPLLLNRWLLQKTRAMRARVVSVGISSGAATSAYPGWSAYCLSKAANAMMSRCLTAEQRERESLGQAQGRQFEIWDFVPGVVDTAMQDLIRAQSAETFPSRDKFVDLKRHGQLASPSDVAQRLVDQL